MCAKAGAPLTAIDLAADFSVMQSATLADDLHFYSVKDGGRIPVPATVRDTEWATVTVPFGWRVQGCWKPSGEQNDDDAVLAAEDAPRFLRYEYKPQTTFPPAVSTVHRSPDGTLLAKGCNDGTVAVYNYPTQALGMEMVTAPGHGTRIAKVRFTCDMRHLIALGQFNRSLTVYAIHDLRTS